MLQFRPMIEFLHSTYTFYHRKGKVMGVAIYIGHRVSMKGMVEVPRSYPWLDGT